MGRPPDRLLGAGARGGAGGRARGRRSRGHRGGGGRLRGARAGPLAYRQHRRPRARGSRGNQAPGWCAGRGSRHRDPPSRPPAQLTQAATADRLRIVIADSYPLRKAATAHREIMAGHTTGKIVLVP
nr:zinc-binding dehydrogenase [Streptomyces sp. SID5914]